jgi:hypothetical protein
VQLLSGLLADLLLCDALSRMNSVIVDYSSSPDTRKSASDKPVKEVLQRCKLSPGIWSGLEQIRCVGSNKPVPLPCRAWTGVAFEQAHKK